MKVELIDLTRKGGEHSHSGMHSLKSPVSIKEIIYFVHAKMMYFDAFNDCPDCNIYNVIYALELDNCEDVKVFIKELKKGAYGAEFEIINPPFEYKKWSRFVGGGRRRYFIKRVKVSYHREIEKMIQMLRFGTQFYDSELKTDNKKLKALNKELMLEIEFHKNELEKVMTFNTRKESNNFEPVSYNPYAEYEMLDTDQVVVEELPKKLPTKIPFEVVGVPHKNHLFITPGKSKERVEWLNLTEIPHVYLGGATRTGKSRILQGIVCQVIANYGHEDVRFIVHDNKKGGELKFLQQTKFLMDYAKGEKDSIEKFELLKAEVERRQDLLDSYDVSNIIELNESGKGKIPFIIFIIDELSPYKKLPNKVKDKFFQDLEHITATCASLGIHIILCNQKLVAGVVPSGVTDNIEQRIGLKCASQTASELLIKGGRLHEIPSAIKGRGKISGDELIDFQAFWIEKGDIESVIQKYCGGSQNNIINAHFPEPTNQATGNAISWNL